ncbi:MAG: FKBP-type peptidyl-prolyl cis-trans isomerase [Fervidicoccaceae archaeon]
MPLGHREFVLVEYTARIKETGELVETTDPEEAKRSGKYEEDREYGPVLVVIGEGRMVRGFEEELTNMNEGEEKTFTVPPEKAFGLRDPNKIRVIPLREFKRSNVEVAPGKVVSIGGVPAVIRDISGGRVTVDFNHPLAGKSIEYRTKIVKRLLDDEEKIKYLLKRRFRPKNLEGFALKLDKESGVVEVTIPREEQGSPDIQLAKRALARDVFKYFEWAKKIVYVEILEKEQEPSNSRGAASGA